MKKHCWPQQDAFAAKTAQGAIMNRVLSILDRNCKITQRLN
jgi:hypothetical protein